MRSQTIDHAGAIRAGDCARRRWGIAMLLALLFAAAPLVAGTGSRVFLDGFEASSGIDAAAAARLLNQATFGATAGEITALQGGDYAAWIDAQIAQPATLSRPLLEQLAVSENQAGRALTADFRIQRWVDVAINAPDQLRQRMAWALSQIVVASDQDGALFPETIMMAEWNDLLVRNALGNYRTLLAEATRSPVMATYLSHLRNRKFELTPRCRDLLAGSGNEVDCSTPSASNNGTQSPVIVAYDPPIGGVVAPDENYAREVMQLFSIGLIERNADFSPVLDAGSPRATYDQEMIATLARVMTGLSYNCSGNRTVAGVTINRNCGGCVGSDCSFSATALLSRPAAASINGQDDLVHPDRYEALICYPRIHDSGRDRSGLRLPGEAGIDPVGASIQLGPGESIPGGTPDGAKPLVLGGVELDRIDEVAAGLPPGSAPNCDSFALSASQRGVCLDYCNQSYDRAIDLLFNHPNTATMLARQLIQRLVDSNPSAQYIGRVAAVFADNGSGVRGDLAAVARAVLLDDEARRAPASAPASAGKLREPLLRLIQLWRSLGAVSGDSRSDGYRRWAFFGGGTCGSNNWPQCTYVQRPLGSASVFNFYSPDYQQPGAIASAGLYSPELQIINENSAILTANDLLRQLCSGYGNDDCSGPLAAVPPGNGGYFPAAVLDALPGGNCAASCSAQDDIDLLDELDLRLFAASMRGAIGNPAVAADPANSGTRGALFRLLRDGLPGGLGEADAQDGRRREILYLLHLIALSPDFSVQH